MERKTEVAIVGGGSTGTSILFHLAKRGKDAILIERNQIASGQTSRSAAILRTHYSHPTLVKMASKSYRFFQNFEEECGGRKCGYRKTGLIIGADQNSEKGLKENVVMHHELGIQSRITDREELGEIEPELDLKKFSTIVYEPEAGYAEPSTTASSFASRAVELGATVLTGTEVTSIKKLKQGFSLETSNGIINAEKVVLAPGAWFNRFSKILNLDVSVHPMRHVVCMFKRPKEYAGTRPIIFDFPRSSAFKPEGQFDLNVSTLETLGDQVDPDNYNAGVNYEEISEFSSRVSDAFPIMSQKGSLSTSFTGLYDNTLDEQPIIDEFSGVGLENLYCLVGLSGHGFKLCPEFGRIMSTLVCGEKFHDYDVSIFRKNRFRDGNLIRSKYQVATIG